MARATKRQYAQGSSPREAYENAQGIFSYRFLGKRATVIALFDRDMIARPFLSETPHDSETPTRRTSLCHILNLLWISSQGAE